MIIILLIIITNSLLLFLLLSSSPKLFLFVSNCGRTEQSGDMGVPTGALS